MMQDPSYWQLAWDTYRAGPRGSKQEEPPSNVSPREALRLSSTLGCLLCGKLRIRQGVPFISFP